MLVLSRKKNESIKIGDNITVTVTDIGNGKVRIGIDAPKEVKIIRTEVLERSDAISLDNAHASCA